MPSHRSSLNQAISLIPFAEQLYLKKTFEKHSQKIALKSKHLNSFREYSTFWFHPLLDNFAFENAFRFRNSNANHLMPNFVFLFNYWFYNFISIVLFFFVYFSCFYNFFWGLFIRVQSTAKHKTTVRTGRWHCFSWAQWTKRYWL